MGFYRTLVELRNAVERMRLKLGSLPDPEHVFWGFGGPPPRYRRPGSDDGLAGSRVPRNPLPSTGGVGATEAVDWEATTHLEPAVSHGSLPSGE
jgi:hypothetical protein